MTDRFKLSICICTYKRPHLVNKLVNDLLHQALLPDVLIVVDGDPNSGAVKKMLADGEFLRSALQIIYIPSNHANLAYQRYLGYLTAKGHNSDFILYLDDDLRIEQVDSAGLVMKPLFEDASIVGVTANTETGDVGTKLSEHPVLVDRERGEPAPLLVQLLGSSRNMPSGSLTAFGERVLPVDSLNGYGNVEWHNGRVMAYRISALDDAIFSDDLFALTHIHCGMGEDLFLSHRVGRRGKMMLAFRAKFFHPHDAAPNSYPIEARRLGYAISYSRRLLNDYYRDPDSPRLADRLVLTKSYLGNFLISWYRFFTHPASHRAAYAWGYTLGMLRGLFDPPSAGRITPQIDWRKDAREATLNQIQIL